MLISILQSSLTYLQSQVMPWLFSSGIHILLIIIVTWLLLLISGGITRKFVNGLLGKYQTTGVYEKKRAETLAMTLITTFRVLIVATAGIIILSEFGINTTALIASAGFMGAALGFGSQSLVKDMISGIFILIENQYRIGDYVFLAGNYGRVKEMGLRTTVIYGEDGVIHYIPNGEIKQSANYSKRKSVVFFDISISAKANVQKAILLIDKTGIELAKDKAFQDLILTPPSFVRLEAFASTGIVLKITGDTKPNKQEHVASIYKTKLLTAFKKANIELAEPPRKILS